MKRFFCFLFTLSLFFTLFFSNINYLSAKETTEDEDCIDNYKSAILQVIDYMNANANQLSLPENETIESRTYEIDLQDGTTAYSTISIEKLETTNNKSEISPNTTETFPVVLGNTYTWTWTVKLDSILGGNSTIKLNYSVSSSSYYSLSGNSATINVTPPQGYALQGKAMYYTRSSGAKLIATGYAGLKSSGVDVYINQYYDVSISGASGCVNITYSSYFL